MKKFITHSIVFLVLIVVGFLFIISRADGYTDPFYIRFTTPKQENLILGTSRAAQGLQPQVFKTICSVSFFNYSFSSFDSPFGETYLNSIKRKIKRGNNDGVFIITVDPWSIVSETEDPNDYANFRELRSCLANTTNVNCNPNFGYLINNLKGRYYEAITFKNNSVFLNSDGWLEVSILMDEKSVFNRTKSKLAYYRENVLPKSKFSSIRLEYLKKTILFLNDYGKVYLVRLPIDSKFMEIENELMPEFNDYIYKLEPLTKGYLDMTTYNSKYIYTDGNHLYKTSSAKVSAIIANWIKNNP